MKMDVDTSVPPKDIVMKDALGVEDPSSASSSSSFDATKGEVPSTPAVDPNSPTANPASLASSAPSSTASSGSGSSSSSSSFSSSSSSSNAATAAPTSTIQPPPPPVVSGRSTPTTLNASEIDVCKSLFAMRSKSAPTTPSASPALTPSTTSRLQPAPSSSANTARKTTKAKSKKSAPRSASVPNARSPTETSPTGSSRSATPSLRSQEVLAPSPTGFVAQAPAPAPGSENVDPQRPTPKRPEGKANGKANKPIRPKVIAAKGDIQCAGQHQKRVQRCRNATLTEYVGPPSRFCAEHIEQDPTSLYCKCTAGFQRNPNDGKPCKEVVLKEFRFCYKHLYLWLNKLAAVGRGELPTDTLDSLDATGVAEAGTSSVDRVLKAAHARLDRVLSIMKKIEEDVQVAKKVNADLYQRKAKLVPKFVSMREQLRAWLSKADSGALPNAAPPAIGTQGKAAAAAAGAAAGMGKKLSAPPRPNAGEQGSSKGVKWATSTTKWSLDSATGAKRPAVNQAPGSKMTAAKAAKRLKSTLGITNVRSAFAIPTPVATAGFVVKTELVALNPAPVAVKAEPAPVKAKPAPVADTVMENAPTEPSSGVTDQPGN